MEVQQSKKKLAEIILSPHNGGQSSSSIERLQVRESFDLSRALILIFIEPTVSFVIIRGYGVAIPCSRCWTC